MPVTPAAKPHQVVVTPKRAKDAKPFVLTVTNSGQSFADAVAHVKQFCPNVIVADQQPDDPAVPNPAAANPAATSPPAANPPAVAVAAKPAANPAAANPAVTNAPAPADSKPAA